MKREFGESFTSGPARLRCAPEHLSGWDRRRTRAASGLVAIIAVCSVSLGPMILQASRPAAPPPIVRGLSVYATDNEQNFPVILRDSVGRGGKPVHSRQYLTIQFDVLADQPPLLKIRFWHCDRDWNPEHNVFLQDETHNTSFILDYRTAPNGVQHYSYRYLNRFPDADDIVRFEYSGKWMFRVMDRSEERILAEGRFIVVDKMVPTSVRVSNEYLTENPSPFNQVHKVKVTVRLPREIDGMYYSTVDVIQNRRLGNSYRIDAADRDPYTIVDGLGTGTREFSVANIYPGNEYRTLDLSSVTRYPNGAVVRPVGGADQLRFYWRTGPGRRGTAILNRFTGITSDYLEVMFRLDIPPSDYRSLTAGGKDIYIVGPFNAWQPDRADQLVFDEGDRTYVSRQLVRRGIYDYQYVTGVYDASNRTVTQQDWVALEGNDWRTSVVYTAFVYYRDPRFGGFDRIVGFAQANSSSVLPGSQ